MPSYILSEPYKQRVDRALSVVEGQPSQGNVTTIPTRFETLPQPASPNPLELAAYPRDFVWKKGSTVEVTLYTQSGTAVGPAMETLSDGSQIPRTVSVTNVSNDFFVPNPQGTTEDLGPTPTMTWCVVGKPRRGDQYVAVEGPMVPVQMATISSQQIGNEWAKGDARTVQITATGQTVEIYSVLDAHTKLDFPNGLVYTKSVDPTDPTKTANVVIGPPAIPLHEARFSSGNDEEEWPLGETKQLLVTRVDGEEVSVSVQNKFFEKLKPGTAAIAIGRFGTSFSVIAAKGETGSATVTAGTLVTPIAPNEQWDAGSTRPVEVIGTEEQVDVLNVYEELTPLDGHRGVLFAESDKDPLGGEGTVNILISPAPKELFQAYFSQGNDEEEWPRGEAKDLIVPAGGGRDEQIEISVVNKFYDNFRPGTHSMAIGKIDGEFCVITKDVEGGEVTPGTLVSPIAVNERWDAGSTRPVTIIGTNEQVDVLNPYDDLTHLEGHRGVLFAKSEKDPLGGEGTTNVLISPAPKQLFEAYFSQGNVGEEWENGQTKTLRVPAADGREEETDVVVRNKFFDVFSPGTHSMAIGRIGSEFCVLTNPDRPEGDVLLANRTDDNEWARGSSRQVQVHGETRTIDVVNLAGDYEAWDAKEQEPNLLVVRGNGLGSSGETQWYVVAPPPKTFDLGTWDGKWSIGSQKQFYLDSNGEGVQASNSLFDLPDGGSGAVVKTDGEWKLVSVQLETAEITIVESFIEKEYATVGDKVTVVTDVEVSGTITQSAASPIDVKVTAVTANYLVVTGVDATAAIQLGSAANPISLSTTLQTSSVTVVSDVNISATLNTQSCAITVQKTVASSAVSIVTGVAVDAELDLDKLDVVVAVNPTYSNLEVINQVDVDVAFDVTKLLVELETTATTSQVQACGPTALGIFVETTATATVLRFPGTVQ